MIYMINNKIYNLCNRNNNELFGIMDNAFSWDEIEVEPAARELCTRLNIDFDAYEDYDTLYNALREMEKI